MRNIPLQKTQLFRTILILVGLASLMMLSCGELNFPNPNAPDLENVPIQTLVSGAEAGMRIDYAIYLRAVSVVGREAYYFEPADPRYTGELLFGRPDPGGFIVNRPWSARYRVVADCRFLLDKANNFSGAEKAGIEGFAKTIMAYQLLLNLNYLDENGIKLDFSGDLNAPMASKAEAFAFIEQNLDEGYTALQAAGDAFPFQLSSGFSGFDNPEGFAKFNRALRARVAIYQNKFQDALDALDASFIDPNAPMDLGVYMVYGTGLGDQTNEIYENPEAPFVKFMAHPSFETDAEAGDQRFASKVFKRSDVTKFDDLTTDLAITVTESDVDRLPIIRNEELLLIRAEANIGLGKLADAQTDINVVRQAAGLGPVTLTDADQAINQLLHERRYSLFIEGHRWVDMRRFGRLDALPIDRPDKDKILDKMPIPETELPESGG
ncbi:MAG: RagB/SusD family nutrient uptake outer membrane protein [Calditrichaeota bacterium]|nr:RagB/SusD family nutrient uptake outer membrane protein [Calditrichota bacterium]